MSAFQVFTNSRSKHFTGDKNSVSNSLRQCSHCRFTRLQLTSERLGAVAASTTVPAGYSLSNLHCRFCGVNAAITPNRPLAVVHFCLSILFVITIFSILFNFSKPVHSFSFYRKFLRLSKKLFKFYCH